MANSPSNVRATFIAGKQRLPELGSELLPGLAVGEEDIHILQSLSLEPRRMDTYDGSMPEENKPSPRFLAIDQVATELDIGQYAAC